MDWQSLQYVLAYFGSVYSRVDGCFILKSRVQFVVKSYGAKCEQQYTTG